MCLTRTSVQIARAGLCVGSISQCESNFILSRIRIQCLCFYNRKMLAQTLSWLNDRYVENSVVRIMLLSPSTFSKNTSRQNCLCLIDAQGDRRGGLPGTRLLVPREVE